MDKTTIGSYDRIAQEYARHTDGFWAKMSSPTFIEEFVASVSGKRILDVGCGTGRDGLIFKKSGLSPTCLDASRAMLKLVSAKGLPAVQGDFCQLPFGESTFDGAWAYTSLLHVPKSGIDGVLSELRRVLKPGGILGLGLIKGSGEKYQDFKNDGNVRLFSYYDSEELHDLLEMNGFEVVDTKEIKPGSMMTLHFLAKSDK